MVIPALVAGMDGTASAGVGGWLVTGYEPGYDSGGR
jgi:hypothetical protein